MKRNLTIVTIFLMVAVFSCSAVFAIDVPGRNRSKRKAKDANKGKYVKVPGALDQLIKIAESMKLLNKELADETRNYNSAAKCLDKGSIKPGMADKEVLKLAGEPVIRLERDDGRGVEWVYKPGKESYFTGNKIYFLFDGNGMFQSWRFVKAK